MKKVTKIVIVVMCALMGIVTLYLSVEDSSIDYTELADKNINLGTKTEFYSLVKEDWIDYIERIKSENDSVSGITPGDNNIVGGGTDKVQPGESGNNKRVIDLPVLTKGYPSDEEVQNLISCIRKSGIPSNRQQALLVMISEFYTRSNNHNGKTHATMASSSSAPQKHSECTPTCVWYGQGGRSAPTGKNTLPTSTQIYVDCSSSVGWAMFYSTQQVIPLTTSTMSTAWLNNSEYKATFDSMQSGDVLLSNGKGHVVMFVGTDTNGNYVYVHASGNKKGIKIDTVPKGSKVGSAEIPVSMSNYFGN